MINFEACPLEGEEDDLFKLLEADLAVPILIHHSHVAFNVVLGGFEVHFPRLLVGFFQHFGDLVRCQVSRFISIEQLEQSPGHVEPCSGYFGIGLGFGLIPAYGLIYGCSTVIVVIVLDSYLFEL